MKDDAMSEEQFKPPEPPPARHFRQSLFFGIVETEESKLAGIEYRGYLRGYIQGLKTARAITKTISDQVQP